MPEEERRSPLVTTAIRVFLGALGGVLICGVTYLLLFELGFLLPPAQARVVVTAPVIFGWVIGLCAIFACWGKSIAAVYEVTALPTDIAPESKRLYLLASIMVLLAVVQYHVSGFILREPTDLPSFVLAARAMAEGRDFYDPTVIASFADSEIAERVVFPYLYLPLYAVLMRPLALLTEPGAHGFFLVLNVLLWPTLVLLCLKLVDPAEHIRAPLLAIVLLVFPSFLPTIQTFHHGSPSLLVAVFVVGVLVAERSGRQKLAGVLLAFVVLIKIVPVIMVLYLALRRRFRTLASAAVVALVLMGLSVAVAGVGPHVHWVTEMAPGLTHGADTGTLWNPGCHPENQAFTGIYCRFLGAESSSYRPLASASGAALLLLVMVLLWRRKTPAIDRLEGSLVVVAILMVSTITWFHHMTMMLLPALTLIVIGAEGKGRGSPAVLFCGAIVLIVIGFEFYLDPWPWVRPNPVTRTLRFQAMVLAMGTLVVLFLREHFKKPSGTSSPEG